MGLSPDNSLVTAFPAGVEKAGAFSTTHWSVVVAAAGNDPAVAEKALEQLCSKYWYPIYVFVRRRGADAHTSEDTTQAFFADLLGRGALKEVDRLKGRFRSFLLASLTNFLNNEWDRHKTLKRGGHLQIISMDETSAEDRYRREPAETVTPETLFERRWAMMLLERVLDQLKQECAVEGKADLFAKLGPGIVGAIAPGLHAEWAAVLDMNEAAVRVALHRLRRRYGELLRHEIANTVADPADVDDEIRHLLTVVSSAG